MKNVELHVEGPNERPAVIYNSKWVFFCSNKNQIKIGLTDGPKTIGKIPVHAAMRGMLNGEVV